ncbi:MAG: hypothetical protein NTX85_01645 [Candidatus Nomurabacteria bacterium]|nr:hypothetical protein [Candidatus Nomurabacteria bacterium]
MNKLIKATLLGCIKTLRVIAFVIIGLGCAAFIVATCYVGFQIWNHMNGVLLVMSDSMRGNLMIALVLTSAPVAIGAMGVMSTDAMLKKLKIA